MSLLSVSIVLFSWLYYSSVEAQKILLAGQVRQSMVQRQHAEQRLTRLHDGVARPLLGVLGEDISSVQIRIAEYLKRTSADTPDNQLIYEQSLLAHRLSTDTLESVTEPFTTSVHILRLDIQLQLAHAKAFLELMQALKTEVGGWPLEVRACDLQKLPVKRLDVQCVMDIYHWAQSPDKSGK